MARRGKGKGKGKGYKNLMGKDPVVHRQSAKGIKQPQRIPHIPNIRTNNVPSGWYTLMDKNELSVYKSLTENKEVHIGNDKNRLPAMKNDLWRVNFVEDNYSSPSDSWVFKNKKDAIEKANELMNPKTKNYMQNPQKEFMFVFDWGADGWNSEWAKTKEEAMKKAKKSFGDVRNIRKVTSSEYDRQIQRDN